MLKTVMSLQEKDEVFDFGKFSFETELYCSCL
jgi:hypothetical protein